MFEDYPAQMGRLSKQEIKGVKKTARALAETSPSDAISYLASRGGYTNFRPDTLIGRIASKPVDYDRFNLIGATTFQDLLGRPMTDTERLQTSEYAKAMGIKDPNAFEAMLSKRLASTPEGQAKIKSESDLEWESRYGTMPRNAQGQLLRGLVSFRPETARQIAQTLVG
jgi:hypothetical protein